MPCMRCGLKTDERTLYNRNACITLVKMLTCYNKTVMFTSCRQNVNKCVYTQLRCTDDTRQGSNEGRSFMADRMTSKNGPSTTFFYFATTNSSTFHEVSVNCLIDSVQFYSFKMKHTHNKTEWTIQLFGRFQDGVWVRLTNAAEIVALSSTSSHKILCTVF